MTDLQAPDATAPEPLRDYQLRKLLTRREKLADAASEALGHDLPGADLLWQAVQQVEERLRQDFPAVWVLSNAEWVAADAARLHTPDRPQPKSCWICRQQQPDTEIRPAS